MKEKQAFNAERTIEDFRLFVTEDRGLFSDEDDRMQALRLIISSRLNEADRNILALYAELGSVRKLGEVLRVSKSSAAQQIQRIREEVLRFYKNGKI